MKTKKPFNIDALLELVFGDLDKIVQRIGKRIEITIKKLTTEKR